MNTSLIIANALIFLTFLVHTFGGDREYKGIEPENTNQSNQLKWTMGRGAFHIVSADFLLATIGITLINFTEYFSEKKLLLNLLAIYFLAYGFAFLITFIISRKFPNIFIKLWQWLLMFVIAGLIYNGTK